MDETFVRLDPAMISGVVCDIDETSLQLQMRNASTMQTFVDLIDATTAAFGQASLEVWACSRTDGPQYGPQIKASGQ